MVNTYRDSHMLNKKIKANFISESQRSLRSRQGELFPSGPVIDIMHACDSCLRCEVILKSDWPITVLF